MPVLQAPVDLCPHMLALERLKHRSKTLTKLCEIRHKEAVGLEGNTPSLHQNKTHRSAKYLAEISRKRKAGETSDLSVKSLPSSVGDLCRHGTPSPLTPPKTTLLTRVLARRRRIIRAREHTKIRIRKFILKALQPFIRKFAPSKISRYTVMRGRLLLLFALNKLSQV